MQVNSAPIISLAAAKRCTVVAAPPLECTPLTQVEVINFKSFVYGTDSGRSSRGERMVLLTLQLHGPAMSMASVTLTVNTGWASITFTASLQEQKLPSSNVCLADFESAERFLLVSPACRTTV